MIVCDRMEEKISEIVIVENRDNVLTRLKKTKTGNKIKESDHNSIITQVKANWNVTKHIQRLEIYNFKDTEGLIKFREMTSSDKFLSEAFHDESKYISVKTKQFFYKRLEFCLSKCFRKV